MPDFIPAVEVQPAWLPKERFLSQLHAERSCLVELWESPLPRELTEEELQNQKATRDRWRSVLASNRIEWKWAVFLSNMKFMMWVANMNEAKDMKVMDDLAEVALEEKVKRPRHAQRWDYCTSGGDMDEDRTQADM